MQKIKDNIKLYIHIFKDKLGYTHTHAHSSIEIIKHIRTEKKMYKITLSVWSDYGTAPDSS